MHRTSTKNHGGIKVCPSALWLTHGFGQIGPTQPHRKRPLQEAVTGSGRYRRLLQEAGGGGGDGCGRYINNTLRQDASTKTEEKLQFSV